MGVFQKTKKTYPFHTDALAYYPDMESVQRELDDVAHKDTASGATLLAAYGPLEARADSYSLFHKAKAGFNDPMSVYFVLDAIVNSQRGLYLRPAYITAFLRDNCGQFFWSVATVGRIMAGMATVAMDRYLVEPQEDYILREHGRTLEGTNPAIEQAEREHLVPFAKGRDSHGKYYVLDPEGGNEGLLWMLQGRKIFMQKAKDSMFDDAQGHSGRNWGNELGAADYYSVEMPDPCRTAMGYRHQLQGGVKTFPSPSPSARKMAFNAS